MESVSLRRAHLKIMALVAAAIILALPESTFSVAIYQSYAQNSTSEKNRAAAQVFRTYSQLEEKGDYSHIYELLSNRFKQKLKTESNVRSASDYQQLRRSSEAQWSQIRLLKIKEEKRGLRFVVSAKVEESGDIQQVRSTYYLVEEDGKWKIDGWTY